MFQNHKEVNEIELQTDLVSKTNQNVIIFQTCIILVAGNTASFEKK